MKHLSSARSVAHDAERNAPAGSSPPHPGPVGAQPQRITPLDVQVAWSHNTPDDGVTLTELLRAALQAKRDNDPRRALLLLGQVNRRLRDCQLAAERQLAHCDDEGEL
jgi:hypothetical protein